MNRMGQLFLVLSVIVITGCGGKGMLIGSFANDAVCTELYAEGDIDMSKVDQFRSALRTQAQNSGMTFEESECNTSGAYGACEAERSENGGTVTAVIYFFGDRSKSETEAKSGCESASGSYRSL